MKSTKKAAAGIGIPVKNNFDSSVSSRISELNRASRNTPQIQKNNVAAQAVLFTGCNPQIYNVIAGTTPKTIASERLSSWAPN